ncbi:hypothetical protein LO762_10660 [Actinocorallia sp. API 0066]|uniref:hypothetical protein n=1 Tax=Actinocorallia sp. API 0066 TaxID=2896846 RepID=UPI001E4A53EC|nr:hypothetical protein [Actinocorallia sp. API 0066]MCD0449646.1 hypothetical protein [Actinocorallia sp. API 0066]
MAVTTGTSGDLDPDSGAALDGPHEPGPGLAVPASVIESLSAESRAWVVALVDGWGPLPDAHREWLARVFRRS